MVNKPLSKEFLLTRGHCCYNNCTNCPYKTKTNMGNQFFYTRAEEVEGSEELKFYKDSFNVNKVIRSIELVDERTLVLIDDLHERVEEKPIIDVKTNKVKEVKRERNTFQSEIYLNKEDREKFYNLTKIN